ncbi:MAG: tRNA lysidine(34) synthetase TilS [Bacteroidetes bacterium]|nr:tRNA lysidine(34) synthetase TilS [Bacteroidota bacterium]
MHLAYQSFCSVLQSLPGSDSLRAILSVSGGVDSMVLLECFRLWAVDHPQSVIHVFHLNHLTRPGENEQEEALVRNAAEGAQFIFHGFRWTQPSTAGNFQASAREERYRLLNQIAAEENLDWLVTAHHRDDAIETLLYRLFTGPSLSNLAPIPVTDQNRLRPLRSVSRSEILSFAIRQRLTWAEDSSNQTDDYTRNRIRRSLIPLLESLFPDRWIPSLETLSSQTQECQLLLHNLAESGRSEWISEVPNGFKIDITGNSVYNDFLLSVLIGEEFHTRWASQPGPGWLLRWLRASDTTKPGLPDGIRWKKRDSFIIFFRPRFGDQQDLVTEPVGETDRLSGNDDTPVLDADRLFHPLKVTFRRAGDRFQPLGFDREIGLSDFLINRKVPVWQRDTIPVIRDRSGKIIWVAGLAISEQVKWTSHTNNWIRLRLVPRSVG